MCPVKKVIWEKRMHIIFLWKENSLCIKSKPMLKLLQEILYNLNMRKACKSSNGKTLQI